MVTMILELVGLLLKTGLQAGGAEKIRAWLTRNIDELKTLQATRKEPGETAPPPEGT